MKPIGLLNIKSLDDGVTLVDMVKETLNYFRFYTPTKAKKRFQFRELQRAASHELYQARQASKEARISSKMLGRFPMYFLHLDFTK